MQASLNDYSFSSSHDHNALCFFLPICDLFLLSGIPEEILQSKLAHVPSGPLPSGRSGILGLILPCAGSALILPCCIHSEGSVGKRASIFTHFSSTFVDYTCAFQVQIIWSYFFIHYILMSHFTWLSDCLFGSPWMGWSLTVSSQIPFFQEPALGAYFFILESLESISMFQT